MPPKPLRWVNQEALASAVVYAEGRKILLYSLGNSAQNPSNIAIFPPVSDNRNLSTFFPRELIPGKVEQSQLNSHEKQKNSRPRGNRPHRIWQT